MMRSPVHVPAVLCGRPDLGDVSALQLVKHPDGSWAFAYRAEAVDRSGVSIGVYEGKGITQEFPLSSDFGQELIAALVRDAKLVDGDPA